MALILCIETSTSVCSVALSKNGTCIYEKADYNGPSHASLLSPYIQEAIEFCNEKKEQLDAVAVSCGPGSYTGLRIGVSTAKGLCFGWGIPLIAIGTLQLLAYTASKQIDDKEALLCPMIDARRMEVYAAIFDNCLQQKKDISADIIDENSYNNYLQTNEIYFFGNGAEKCKETLQNKNAHFLTNIHPLAKNMARLAENKFEENRFEDVAYFEPFYLKDFIATKPKNKIL